MKPNNPASLFKNTQEKTTLLDVSISKPGIVIQAAVTHGIATMKKRR